jgi:DHA3 family macrolide efflux protein-like MFS transporter
MNQSNEKDIEADSRSALNKAPTKLLNKDFILLWQGQFVSQLGNQVHGIAMMFWVKHVTGSATLMGMLVMLSMLPAVILGPLGGTFADRHSRRKIIIYSDLISGILVLMLALIMFYLPKQTNLTIVWLTITYIIMGIISSVFSPAIIASVPDLVPKEKIAAANSMRQSSYQIASFFGQGLGGVLFRVLGAPMLFLVDAISFIFSSFSVIFIRIPQKYPQKVTGFKAIFQQFKKDTVEGLRYIRKRKGMRDLFFAAAFLNFFMAPIGILLPFYIEDTLKSTPDWFGYMLAMMGVGALLGYMLAGLLKIPGHTRSILIIALLFLESITIGILGFIHTAPMATTIAFIIGLMNGTINIYISTILQTSTPSEIRGRVFGLLATLSGGLMPISMGLAGVVLDLADKNVTLIFAACGGLTALCSLLLTTGRDFREFLAYEQPRDTASS